MESINDIQNRLQGLEDIKHLLRSVRAMSAIRWRRAKNHLGVAQSYAAEVDAQLGILLASTGGKIAAISFAPRMQGNSKVVGLITLTSDRGLCGNFNTGIVSEAISMTKHLRAKGNHVRIISLGGYGERIFRMSGFDIFQSETIPDSQATSFVDIRKVVSHIRAYYESGMINELVILFNKFNYFGSYTPESFRLLPPEFENKNPTKQSMPEDLIINGNKANLQAFLLWEHLAARLYLAYIESTVSEHSARLQTMDSAISNLDERVAELEIKYHTIRQEKITQEVLGVQSNLRDRKKED
jgi:F-type H+-transporting ATPase subunit gamma